MIKKRKYSPGEISERLKKLVDCHVNGKHKVIQRARSPNIIISDISHYPEYNLIMAENGIIYLECI